MADLGNILKEGPTDQEASLSTRDMAQGPETILSASLERLSDAADMRKFLEHVFEEILRVTGATNASATRYDRHTNELQLELFVDGSGTRWGMSGNEIALWASPYDADTTPSFRIGRQNRRVFAASLLKNQTEVNLEDFALPGGLEYIVANGISDAAFSVLSVGDEPVGTFHLHFTGGRVLQPDDLTVLQGLSQQAAIALRFVALSEEAQRGAIARERELSERRRSAELIKANEALSECIRSLKDIEDIESFLHSVLIVAERVSGSAGAAAFTYGSDGRLCMKAYVEGGAPFPIVSDPRMEVWRDEVEWTDGFSQIWRDICGDRGYWISPSNDPRISEKYHQWHRQRGHAITLCLPLAQGDRFLGFLGLAFTTHVEPDKDRLELTRSLAQQTTLAVEANRLAQEAQQAAVAREREREAQIRAEEANRISSFLNATIGQMSEGGDLYITVESILAGLAKEIGATHVFLFRHDAATRLIRLELSFIDGQIRHGASGDELALWAAPFRDDLTPGWQIMAQKRGLFTPEMVPIPAEEFAWPGTFEYATRSNLSDMGHIVLFAGNDPVGSIGFGLTDGRKLRPADKPFVEGVAKQAALAIRMIDLAERAKLTAVADMSQRAAQEKAEELTRANAMLMSSVEAIANSDDPKMLLEHFLLQAMKAAGASGGSFTLYEDGRYKDQHCVAQDGRIVPETEWRKELLFIEAPAVLGANIAGFFDRLMSERITRDRLEDIRAWWPAAAEYHEKRGHVEIWNVACVAREQVIASFGLGFASVPEMAAVEPMLIALAQQAALALELHRLSNDAKQEAIRREQEKAVQARADELAAVNQTLTSSFRRIATESETVSAPPIFLSDIAKAASADLCYWLDYDPLREEMSLSLRCKGGVIVTEPEADEPELFSSPFPASMLGDFIKSSAAYNFVVLSVERDADRLWPATAHWHRKAGRKQVMCFAVTLGDRLIGMLAMAFREEMSWSSAKTELIRSLANHMALSVHLCRLSEQASRGAAMEERTRLAREIHDTLAQGFSGILVQLRAMQQAETSEDEGARKLHFENALELANTGLSEARRSLASLRLRELEGRSFREALSLMAQSATKRAGVPIRLLAGVDLEVGPNTEAELLRIAQESVTNSIKHSGASQITIALRHGVGTVDLCIEDDGKGFDPRKTTEGFGLLGMQERAAKIGATMTIESSATGTSVCVHLKRGGRDA